MKRTTKNKVLALSALLATLSIGSLAVLNVNTANAAENSTVKADNTFYMGVGAEVRAPETNGDVSVSGGIRFRTYVKETFALPSGASDVQYGTLVYKAVDDIASLTLEAAASNEDIYNLLAPVPVYTDEANAEEVYEYTATITYDELDSEIFLKAANLELSARAYVSYTLSGESYVVYAQAEDTTRSMSQVARAEVLLNSNLTQTEIDNLSVYYEGAEEATLDYSEAFFAANESTNPYTPNFKTLNSELPVGNYLAYLGGERVDLSVTAENNEQKFTFGTLTATQESVIANLAIGATANVVLVDAEGNVYNQPVRKVTKMITTRQEFQGILPKNLSGYGGTTEDGYYVLAVDNLTYSATSQFIGTGSTQSPGTFTGTFDGNGGIVNVNVEYGAIFGNLGAGAVIKNTHFVVNQKANADVEGSNNVLGKALSGTVDNPSTVENVYVEVVSSTRERSSITLFQANFKKYVNLKDVVFDISAIDSQLTGTANNWSGFFKWDSAGPLAGMDNTILISSVKKHIAEDTSSRYMYAGNDEALMNSEEHSNSTYESGVGTYRYDSRAAMASVWNWVGDWCVTADGVSWNKAANPDVRIINSASSFQALRGANNEIITGNYVLTTDIGSVDNYVKMGATANVASEFQGTFDGKGHTVYVDVGYGGIFGHLGDNAVIKNVHFVVKQGNNTNQEAYNAVFARNIKATKGHAALVENVYVEVVDSATNRTSLTFVQNGSNKYIDLKNVVFDISAVEDKLDFSNYTDALRSGIFLKYNRGGGELCSMDNVTIISSEMKYIEEEYRDGQGHRRAYASNDTALRDSDIAGGNVLETYSEVVAGTYRYDTAMDMYEGMALTGVGTEGEYGWLISESGEISWGIVGKKS